MQTGMSCNHLQSFMPYINDCDDQTRLMIRHSAQQLSALLHKTQRTGVLQSAGRGSGHAAQSCLLQCRLLQSGHAWPNKLTTKMTTDRGTAAAPHIRNGVVAHAGVEFGCIYIALTSAKS
jgi:hypothetical protein